MHSVLSTPTFEADAKRAGLTEDEIDLMVTRLAREPTAGDLIPRAGGARKLRFARKGMGKSGGYRTIHYYGGEDVPVFLLALVDKGERADLTQAERNALAHELARIADDYRTGVAERLAKLKRRL